MPQHSKHIDDWVVDQVLGANKSVLVCHREEAPSETEVLKIQKAERFSSPEQRVALEEEFSALSEIRSDSLARVTGWSVSGEVAYVRMEHVAGEPLGSVVLSSDPTGFLLHFERLAGALALLHERGLVHGDVKPQNVRMRGLVPVLVDLGTDLTPGGWRRSTMGLTLSTVSYLPPEWGEQGKVADPSWDVYSLGTLFWEVLVGRRAFAAADDLDLDAGMRRVMELKVGHPPLDPGPDAPFFLRLLIRDMTHPDPSERPAHAGEVLHRLQAGEAGAALDPVELFRTPMPTWYAEDDQEGPDRLPTSEVPVSPASIEVGEPDWWRSFVSGALAGGLAVAALFGVGIVWVLGFGAFADGETSTGPVQAGALAAWVAENPDWSVEAVVASRLADGGYLQGYGEEVETGPAVRVSWYVARAYCARRGGLAGVEVDVAEDLNGEWRQDEGRPVLVSSDGSAAREVEPSSTRVDLGFRCEKQ